MRAQTEIDIEAVEAVIRRYVEAPAFFVLHDVANHVLGSGGKRVRPLLLLWTARALGGSEGPVLPLAAAVEILHAGSLLLDDVIDTSPLRRGEPSANAIWGNKRSVLGGAYLFSVVFRLLADLGRPDWQRAFSSTMREMCEGEALQIAFRGNAHMTEADYLEVIGRKTGSLFELSCRLGAEAATANGLTTSACDFGRAVGLAFQIQDDVLDYTGTDESLGKPAGRDLGDRLVTLPLIYALRAMEPVDRERAVDALRRPFMREDEQRALMEAVRKRGGVEEALAKSHALIGEAEEALGRYPGGPAREALSGILDALKSRRA
ncbi:MAG: polyprenyl synthetase family protein [Nitrospirae bacterium]|nr:polyprenyl synthetase family protein [Nitrospirota bacterium]